MSKLIKKSQDQKSKIFLFVKNKFGQEEMVGFALIIVIVSIILLAFLGFSLSKSPEPVQSYEVESFIQSALQYTTDCKDSREYLNVQDLIFQCDLNAKCSDERDSCEVLNESLKQILDEAWPVGEQYPRKGYELKIETDIKSILEIKKGETAGNYKEASQIFSKQRKNFELNFKVFS